ncbi:YggS family pyridoxal phosphate-dependent enzyme [Idiomarina seosinensis]|uniref:Pyridoxal phosphate homeostasis protein n=1 Tax=Idiomarina seosinensis TaxID=281739 RepID=A0A432Z4G2_9GAMM|nr:YggS family pyridoxal phosphate-dependent enzyme [Idiomarina seosinensis]RUO72771.1 YggS family pyridoxal phosphate-dependent enzyme [Idiomarina seosinensis]
MTKVAEKTAETIAKNLTQIEQQLANLANESAYVNQVTLVAVSKRHSSDAVRAAADAGQRQFAENYVQEGVTKIAELQDETLTWHFIGPLQSNKTKDVATHFDWVQSVEREKIARRLNEQRPADLPPLNILLQVNIDDDDNKSGLAPAQVEQLAEYVNNCQQLKLRGLMTILKANTDSAQQQQSFAQMRALYQQLQASYGDSVDTLSMGMSGDMRQAVLEGANMVRIGTAIFGQRE